MKTSRIHPLLSLLLCCGGFCASAFGQKAQPTPEPIDDKDAKFNAYIQQENNHELSEYARVIDQYGNPVVGADVSAKVFLNLSFTESGTDVYKSTTDANGLCGFSGLHGAQIGIDVEKPGYEANSGGFKKAKGGGQSTPTNRETLVMWKLQGADQMVLRSMIVCQPCDGTAIAIDLLTGKTVKQGGDLIVRFARRPVQIVRGKPFAWTATYTVPKGGLIEIHDPYPYVAPADDYHESITVSSDAYPVGSDTEIRKSYYIKTPDGKFGRISISLTTDFPKPPTFLGITSYINISGTNNLEYLREKDPKASQLLQAPPWAR